MLIHGGPWSRDLWQPGALDTFQFLNYRGYAVMTVYYRGSTGSGQAFTNAAIKTLRRYPPILSQSATA